MNTLFETDIIRSCVLSDCGLYRYHLARSWQQGGRTCCFVMLNPSTADDTRDDPTIRRCIGFARAWGYSTLWVRNLYSWRATNPGDLLRTVRASAALAIGPQGNRWLQTADEADMVVAAWGGNATEAREREAFGLLASAKLHCLGLTNQGQPRHPLYCRGDLQPVLFREAA